MKKARILIVDDNELIRSAMRNLLEEESDFEVCGEADSIAAALKALEELKPDMALVDISLDATEDGLELIERMKSQNKNLLTLALSLHEQCQYESRALEAGANGYLMKQHAADNLVSAIRQILSGEKFLGSSACADDAVTDRNSLSKKYGF